MNTVKDIYDAYPSSDLIPVTVTDETTLRGLEEQVYDNDNLSCGDTLFLFLCRELAAPSDVCDKVETGQRLDKSIRDLTAVSKSLLGIGPNAAHFGSLMASQIHAIIQLEKQQKTQLTLGDMLIEVLRGDATYTVYHEGASFAVGNLFGVMEKYLQLAMIHSERVWVFE